MPPEQDFTHHVRWLPPYHFVVGPILLVNLGHNVWQLTKSQDWPGILDTLVALALVLLYFYARYMVIRVQDRVIRCEERSRMERLFPADLRAQIEKFSVDQLVALRFASDGELPALSRTVLEKGIADRREIKAMITTWRADHLRA